MLTGAIASSRQPVRDWFESCRLQYGRRAGGGAGTGGGQGIGTQGSGCCGNRNTEQAGRIAYLGAEIRHTVGGSDHAIAGCAASLQPGRKDDGYEKGTRRLCLSSSERWNWIRILLWLTPAWRVSYNNLNEAGRAAENARKAYALREKVSERERLRIETSYYMFATGELEKAAQTFEQWQQSYPRDGAPYTNLRFHLHQPWKLGKGVGGSPWGNTPKAESPRATIRTSP